MEHELDMICHDPIPLDEKTDAIRTLTAIIQNAMKNPHIEKYRQLRLANKSFSQHVWRHSAAQKFLALAGWVVVNDKIVLSSLEKLQEAHAQLVKAQAYLGTLQLQKMRIVGRFDVTNEGIIKTLKLSKSEASALEKYRLLLPKVLEEWYAKFCEHHDGMLCVALTIEKADINHWHSSLNTSTQQLAKEFRRALKLIEQRDSLLLLRQRPTTDIELQRIEEKLAELELEEAELIYTCEDACIRLIEIGLSIYDRAASELEIPADVKVWRDKILAELDMRLEKKSNRLAIPISSTGGLDFSAYISALPATAQSYLEKQIDSDHEGVDIHLNQIAYNMEDWETKMSTLLGLTSIEIKDLKSMYSKPILLRREVLKTWQAKEGFRATYGKLLKLCCNGGDTHTAKIICDLLKEKAEEIDGNKEETAPVQEKAKPVDPITKKPRLLPLCKEMAVLSELWKDVGLFLDLSQQDLDEVESKHSSTPSKCMTAVLKKWLLREDPPPTWEAVIEVVEFLQHKEVASALKRATADQR